MLKIIRTMKELEFGKLLQVYDESCVTLDAQGDFYEYLRQVFFKTPGAVYCVWQEGETYVSALRLEPYRNGLILSGLETAVVFRRHGFAGALVDAVIAEFGDAWIYSHINHGNHPSRAIHLRRGFRQISECAVFLDGSATDRTGTYLYKGTSPNFYSAK